MLIDALESKEILGSEACVECMYCLYSIRSNSYNTKLKWPMHTHTLLDAEVQKINSIRRTMLSCLISIVVVVFFVYIVVNNHL